jgi:hypothetical protein
MRNTVLLFGLLVAAASLATGQSYIGRVDTIGGTTYDWWVNGNVHRSLANSPQFGIHAVWMYSAEQSGTTFPDRNTRYNFYDYSARQWNWTDPDHMQSGVNVFPERTGFGVIDADTGGRAIIGAHNDSGLVLAWDAAPGAGIFDYSGGLSGYYWPDIAVGDDSVLHVAMSSGTGAFYSRLTGSGWDSVRVLDSLAFPTYAIAASKAEPSVCATWVGDTSASYLLSENRGDTWGSRILLDPPPAFGGDTVTRFSMHGLFPFFDSQGRLHIAAAVYPEVRDTAYTNPAEIWHWCPANQPHWARIHHAGCLPENMQGGIGYNAIYADRPSMGESDNGCLYVAWEQFDSSNVEPQTERLRAGVWASRSTNNGASWGYGLLLTERNTMSHRFPCIVDRMIGNPPEDTICVLYLMDQVAGFFVRGEGPATSDPVVCQFVPTHPHGVAERPGARALDFAPAATIVRGVLFLPRDMTETSDVSDRVPRPTLLDASGRKVLDFHPGANDVRALAPGVYFVRDAQGQGVTKVVITR